MAFDLKYGFVIVENDSERHPLNGTDEPVFVLRAQDVTSLHTLKYYQQGLDDELSTRMDKVIERFTDWQAQEGHLIKSPD